MAARDDYRTAPGCGMTDAQFKRKLRKMHRAIECGDALGEAHVVLDEIAHECTDAQWEEIENGTWPDLIGAGGRDYEVQGAGPER